MQAHRLDIIGRDGRLVEYMLPAIVRCLAVKSMHGGFFGAECVLDDGRKGYLLGESESGELPDVGWFVGRDTGSTARYSPVEKLARKQAPD